jgi:uncharacterized protein
MSWRRVVVIVLGVVVALYVSAVLLLQRSLLFPRPSVRPSVTRPLDATQVWLNTSSGQVEAWYLPPLTIANTPAPAIVYFHGNAELIDFVAYDFQFPRRWGMGVLLVEFPGYGRSAGSPSQGSVTAVALAAYDWLSERALVDPSRIVVYGRSLGGGAAAALAAQRKPAAVVLESTFASVRSLAHRFWVPEFAVLDPFDSAAAIGGYAGPVLVLHGKDDELVPAEHAKLLAAVSHRSELHLLDCGHNDCDRPWSLVRAFLKRNRVLGQ